MTDREGPGHRLLRGRAGLRSLLVGLLALSLAGCATAGPPAPATPSDGGSAPASPGDVLVAVIGTPFFLVFKTVTCAATLVIAPPVSALAALTDRDDKAAIRRSIDEGTSQNCGGSWVLTPGGR
jgi:hypothetical protein